MVTVKIVEDVYGSMKMQLDPYEILHDVLTGEQRQLLIESLSCHEEIIGNVAELLIDGYTYNGFSGEWCPSRNTALQQAKQKIAENSSDAVERTIADMDSRIKSLENDLQWYREKLAGV